MSLILEKPISVIPCWDSAWEEYSVLVNRVNPDGRRDRQKCVNNGVAVRIYANGPTRKYYQMRTTIGGAAYSPELQFMPHRAHYCVSGRKNTNGK